MIQEINSCIERGDLAGAAQLIREAVDQGVSLHPLNIRYAHVCALAAHWDAANKLLPTNTNSLMATGWLASLSMGRPVNAKGEPIPWLTYPAIDFLDRVCRKDWHVLEWGSGNSTLWWSARVATIVAIENDQAWHDEVKGQMPSNAKLLLRTDPEEYALAPARLERDRFDVIVIDGSHRNECARAAIGRVSEDGLVIFDNSDGAAHKQGQQALMDAGFYRLDFWGLIPSYLYRNCTSVYFKNPELLRRGSLPADHRSSLGLSCQQSVDLMQGNA